MKPVTEMLHDFVFLLAEAFLSIGLTFEIYELQ